MKPALNITNSHIQNGYNDEDFRFRELSRYSIVYDEPEPEFDSVANLVSQIVDAPICGISLVDSDHVWLKARIGIDINCINRGGAFCAYAVDSNQDFFEVNNTLNDPRFVNNPLVVDLSVRYYAAAVLKNNNGYSLGTLWIMDKSPRKLSDKYRLILLGLASQILSMLNRRYLSPISQLPNLSAFKENLQCALNQHFTSQSCLIANCNRLLPNGSCLDTGGQERCAVGFIKFLNIYQLNRIFGRNQIDLFVQQLAQAMLNCLGPNNLVSQISISKFALTFFYHDQKELDAKIEELQTILAQPFLIKDASASITAAIGLSLFPQHGFNVSVLLEQAENAALGPLETTPQRSIHLYKKSLENEVNFIVDLHRDLETSQHNERIIPHYQPQVNILTGELIGFEALARWQHPTYGLTSPSRFMPLLERNDLIFQLDMQIFKSVCRDLTEWLNAGLPVKPVSCNFARSSFLRPELKKTLQRVMTQHSIPKGLIELELTENGLNPNKKMIDNINVLHDELGLAIAIDDFGAGLSNLEILRKINFSRLKVDRQFVHDVAHNQYVAGILNLIHGMAKLFQKELVCEGLENIEDLLYLQKAGIANVQGWIISQSLAKDSVKNSLKRFDISLSQRKQLIENPLKLAAMFVN